MALLDLHEVAAARARIQPWVARTPLVTMATSGVVLKAESLQRSGSFKLRGAFHALLLLDGAQRARGVVAHSSGNHAVAVAMAGADLGVPVTVVMPSDAPEVKRRATETAGAEVVLVGPSSSERADRAGALAAERGLALVEPYDSDAVLAATATIALEVLEDLSGAGDDPPELYVPISGGGLAGGEAAGAKLTDARVRVIGVEPEVAADALASRRAGRPVALPAEQMARTIADGLRVQRVGERPWPHLEAFVDEIVTVTEAEIRAGMRAVAAEARLVAEPSGAVAVAAALAGYGSDSRPPSRRVAVLTGGNVDLPLLTEILAGP